MASRLVCLRASKARGGIEVGEDSSQKTNRKDDCDDEREEKEHLPDAFNGLGGPQGLPVGFK